MLSRLLATVAFVLSVSTNVHGLVLTSSKGVSPPLPKHYPVVADPSIPVPGVNPPVAGYPGPTRVSLFPWTNFTNYAPNPFNYTPPSSSSPSSDMWAKIVLELQCRVTKGRQFDRTAFLSIGNSTLFIGTTAEPTAQSGPEWNVTSDVTRYAALLAGKKGYPGQIYLPSIVDSTYNGVPMCRGDLAFYPVDPANGITAPTEGTPIMAGLGSFTNSGNFTVKAGSEFTKYGGGVMFADIFIQNQGGDEFFWSCLPNNYSNIVGTCGNGALRFGEVLIDGELVGLAPAYPYIFTGGIDPGLWNPIPSSRTLNLVPLRVDLSYFVGMFTDGKDHNITIRVVGGPSPSGQPGPTNSFWNIAGTLFFYPNPEIESTRLVYNNLRSVVKTALSSNQSVESTLTVSGKHNDTVIGWVKQVFNIKTQKPVVSAEIRMKNKRRELSSTTTIGYALDVDWSNTQYYNMTNSYSNSQTRTSGVWSAQYSSSHSVGFHQPDTSLQWNLDVTQHAKPDPQNASLMLQKTDVAGVYIGNVFSHGQMTNNYWTTLQTTDTMVIDQKESYVLNFTNQSSWQSNDAQSSQPQQGYECMVKAEKNKITKDSPNPHNDLQWTTDPLVMYQGYVPFAFMMGSSSSSEKAVTSTRGIVVDEGLPVESTPQRFSVDRLFVQNPKKKFGKDSSTEPRSVFLKNTERF